MADTYLIARKPSPEAQAKPATVIAALVLACMLALPNNAIAQCQYEVTAIISPDDEDACSPLPASLVYGRGMNSHGDVVGYYVPCALGNERAFFWSEEGGFVTLPVPAGVLRTHANDINDNRQIVGQHLILESGWMGFVYDVATGEYEYLQTLHPGVDAATLSDLRAINNSGIAVGSRAIGKPGEDDDTYNAVIWNTTTGEVTDLGVGEGPNSGAVDVNEAGDAAGWTGNSAVSANARAVLWNNGQATPIGVPSGYIQSAAHSINKHNHVLGWTKEHLLALVLSFHWLDGEFTFFKAPPGFTRFSSASINDFGHVLGTLDVYDSNETFATIWQNGQYHILNTLVNLPPDSSLTIGVTIDNSGRALTRGSTSGVVAMLLSPVGQPLADLNHDCDVNEGDLLILLESWGPTSLAAQGKSASPADLNGDGIVNVSDLLILLANWSH